MTGHGHPVIGILGGMGPEATVDLMRRVVEATPARDDEDHLHLIVDNNPKVPSRIKALIEGTGVSPVPVLVEMTRGLNGLGVDALAIPCNTAHAYLPEIRAASRAPVLDMVALTAERIAAMELTHRRVGLLASTAVRLTGLYEKALAARGLEAVFPARQDEVLALIKAVKAKSLTAEGRAAFREIGRELLAERTDLLLIACTELSVIAEALDAGSPVLDSMQVLAEAIVAVGLGDIDFDVPEFHEARG